MADQDLNVNIKGDARQFLKSSAEATKAAQEMGKATTQAMDGANKAAEKLADNIQQVGASSDQAAGKVSKLSAETAKTGNQAGQATSAWNSLRTATTAYLASIVTNPLAQMGAALVLINRAIGEVTSNERAAAGLMGAFASDKNIANLERTNDLIGKLADRSSFFGDDAVSEGAIVLKNLGATQDQLEALLPAATDLAAVYGTSIPDAARKLANGIIGDTKALRDFGINIKSNSTTAERYTAILQRQGKASKELAMLDDGLSGAMGRLGKATDDAFGQAGSSFQNFLTGGVTVLTKMIQAIALVPPAIELVATSIVGILGDVTIQLEGVRESFFNLFSGKGFKAPNADRLFGAWRKQIGESMDKAFGELGKRFQALTGQDIGKPVSGRVPQTQTGLIAPPGEIKPGPEVKAPPTLTEQALSLAKVKEAFGVTPSNAIFEAAQEIARSVGLFTKTGVTFDAGAVLETNKGRNFTTDEMNLLGLLQGGLIEVYKNSTGTIVDSAIEAANAIQDPITRLQALIEASDRSVAFATGGVSMAFTGEQKQAAQEQLSEELKKRKALGVELVKAEADRNGQFLNAFNSMLQQFIGAFADTIGRSLAGGNKGPSGGDIARSVGGIAAAGAGIASGLVTAGATVALGGVTLPLAGLIAGVGVAIGGLSAVVGGFLDQQDENAQYLQTLVEQGKESLTNAKLLLGTMNQQEARFQSILQPLVKGAQSTGGALGGAEAKIISWFGTFGDQQARQQLKTLSTWITTGVNDAGQKVTKADVFGLLNTNLGLGLSGTQQEIEGVINTILGMFTGIEGFYRGTEQQQLDAEMAALGSTPRNPVYIWDVTPQEERFTFQPREAFFRAAATRQFGRNEIVTAAAMS